LKAVQYLVSVGADVNAEDEGGNTPLHEAARFCDGYEVLEYLISQGADVWAINDKGERATTITMKRYFDCKDRGNTKESARLKKSLDLLRRATRIDYNPFLERKEIFHATTRIFAR